MKIPEDLRSILQVCTALVVACVLVISGAYLQATSPNPKPAISHAMVILKGMIITVIVAGFGFLTEEE